MQLLFIHGSGGCRESWKYQTDYFAGSEAIDLPGHPVGDLRPTIPEYVSWLHGYIREKEYHDVILAGHSLGGGIALQYALDYPGDLAALITVGSGGRLRVHSDFLAMLEKAVDDPSLLAEFNRTTYDQIDSALADTLRKRAEENTPASFLNDLKACDRFDVMDRLETISLPMLAVVGDKDIMTPPKYSGFMAEKMPNARVEVISGGTHFVFAEKPDEVNRAIEAFIRSI